MDALIGNGVTSTQEFKNNAGTLTDPTTISVTIRQPSGTKTTYIYNTNPEVVRDSAGTYTISFVPDSAGPWGIYWLGTGTVPRATEVFVTINPSRVLL